jgi:hypothetical protein
MKEQKHLLIGYDFESEALFTKSANDKIEAFKDARAYCEQFIEIKDLDKFAESFTNYLLDELRPTVNGRKNTILDNTQIALINGVNISVIKFIENRYKTNKSILNPDYVTFNLPCFEVYAENKVQSMAFVLSLELMELIKKIDKITPINIYSVRKAVPLMALNGESELIPNATFIKSL